MSAQAIGVSGRDPDGLPTMSAAVRSGSVSATGRELPASVFAAVLEDLYAAGTHPLRVVLRHALAFADAATAALALPSGPDRLEIRAVSGLAASQLIGRTFPRSTSIAGHVIDAGKPEVIDQFVPQFSDADISRLGPAIVVPLRAGTQVVGALSLARLREDPPFTKADLDLAFDFAELAGVALHLDQARTNREAVVVGAERDRIAGALSLTVIRELSDVMLQIDAVNSGVNDASQRTRLFKAAEQIHALIRTIRQTIYSLPADRPETPIT